MKYLRLHDGSADEDYQVAVEDDHPVLSRIPDWVRVSDEPHHYATGGAIPLRELIDAT